MTTTFIIISGVSMLIALFAAFLPWNVKPMVDSFREATRREFEIKGEKKVGEIDPEEALHLVLQWRFKRAALFLGFAALILVCTTFIIVKQPQVGAFGTPTKNSQETKAILQTNQISNTVPPNDAASAPQ